MQQGTRNAGQLTPRNDILVVAEFAGIFIKELKQINKIMQLYLSSDKEILCPFRGKECIKVRGRPTGKPLPLCAIRLKNGSYLAVCHERIANEVVVKNLVKEVGLKARYILSNVRLPSGRSYDFLVAAHKTDKSNGRLKLIFLEVITVDTTNTGSLLKVLLQSQDKPHKRHNIYINWENVRKREVVQMLYKNIVIRKIANILNNNIDVCYVGVIQKDTYYRLFENNGVYKTFDDFCSEYISYDKFIGFLLFTMAEYDARLVVRLNNVNVAAVDLEKLIGAYPRVIEHDVRGLLQRLQRLINGNASQYNGKEGSLGWSES